MLEPGIKTATCSGCWWDWSRCGYGTTKTNETTQRPFRGPSYKSPSESSNRSSSGQLNFLTRAGWVHDMHWTCTEHALQEYGSVKRIQKVRATLGSFGPHLTYILWATLVTTSPLLPISMVRWYVWSLGSWLIGKSWSFFVESFASATRLPVTWKNGVSNHTQPCSSFGKMGSPTMSKLHTVCETLRARFKTV